jgi:hypothetical protein
MQPPNHPNHHEPPTYQLRPETEELRQFRVSRKSLVIAWAATGLAILALAGAAFGWVHETQVASGLAVQIRGLDQSNTRMAGEISQLSGHQATMSASQARMSARMSSADPASSLITCKDLRAMDLTTVSGGSVSSVPGTVNLSYGAVQLPKHCNR